MSNEHKECGERLKALTDDQISETLGKLIDTDQAGTDRFLKDVLRIPDGLFCKLYLEGYRHASDPHNSELSPYPPESFQAEQWRIGYRDAVEDNMEDPERFDGMG